MSVQTLPTREKTPLPNSVPLIDIHSDHARRALGLWNRLKGARRFPSRMDISPRDLGDLLRHTALVRLLTNGDDFEVRLVGDAIVQAQGISFGGYTASMVDALSPEYASELRQIFARLCENGQPLVFRGWYGRNPHIKSVYHETIFLPLGPEDTVDHVLIVASYAINGNTRLR